jgi:hypothetical protein
MGARAWSVRSAAAGTALLVALAGCGSPQGEDVEPLAGGAAPSETTATRPSDGGSFPSCEDVPQVSAPEAAYADSPVYVENEMPIAEVQAWARRQPGFEEIWIDRDHNGWITVAFSVDADERQADLEEEFPGVGVVAVAVEWRADELERLARRSTAELANIVDSFSVSASVTQGVVGIEVGALTDEVRAEIGARLGGEPICLDGGDPATLPPPGPQPPGGEGWRLLVDEAGVGEPYRTGIAFDPLSLDALWAEIGVRGPLPDVDFQAEVAIWFGAVYSGSCPEIRLDDVVVDEETATVYAAIVDTELNVACTADANPRAYVVALERDRLPAGPFAIQLGPDDPPPGALEERTVVAVDLSQPGSIAAPDEVGTGPGLPPPQVFESGSIIEPGFAVDYRLYVHCGVEWLGELNGVIWRTGEAMPSEWVALVGDEETVVVSVLLGSGPEPSVAATAGGVTVVYLPDSGPQPGCD